MAHAAWCRVERPRSAEEVVAAFETMRRDRTPTALRGAGYSYGDAACLDGGLLLDLSAMNRILSWDPAAGRATVEPGATIRDLWRRAVPDGWWPSVVPGTMAPTWGGCAAMNVHGKNHFASGALDSHVESLEILLPTLERLRCAPEENADLFAAVLGGAGLLGCITSLTLRLHRIRSGLLDVEAVAAETLDGCMDAIEARLGSTEYQVGWIDAFDPRGRGLVHAARHLEEGEDADPAASLRAEAQDLPRRFFGVVPRAWMRFGLAAFSHDPGMQLVNEVKWRLGAAAGETRHRQTHAAFHFLLDYVPDWKRAYLPGGLVQYQPFIPRAAARAAFAELLRLARARGLPPYLAVLKRHRPSVSLLAPYLDGWSLALDFRVPRGGREGLTSLAREMDRVVVEAGGRFYLAKDSMMTPEVFRSTVPPAALEAFLAAKRRCDPEGLLRTDLSRRVGLG